MGGDGNEWVIAHRSRDEVNGREYALVLQAAGIEHRVRREPDGFILEVATIDVERSRAELAAYGAENHDWYGTPSKTTRRAGGWGGAVGFFAVLVLMAVLEQGRVFGVDWSAAGKAQANLIRQGEWWRTVTALTLHVDSVHLLSNLVIGSLVGFFAGQSLGSGFAWCTILIAGALGNLLNAWVHPPDHTSVGASTAVFAALGLMAAHAWRRQRSIRSSWRERWTPLVGGVLLLGLLGTGGGRTDVAAHVFGFLCAIPLGVLCTKLAGDATFTRRVQILLGLTTLAIVVFAWALALVRYRT